MQVLRKYSYVAAFALLMSLAPAYAQSGWQNDGRPDRRDQDNIGSQAYRAGYQDGVQDVQRHGSPHPNSSRWRNASDRNAYAAGYQAGYNEAAQQRNGTYGNGAYGSRGNDRDRDYGNPGSRGYGYGQNAATELQRQAQQTGYGDGAYYAQKDMQSGVNNDPTKAKGYKDADHNYNSSLGSKDEFKRIYRQAFIDGYQRVWRGRGQGQYSYGQNAATELQRQAQQTGYGDGAYYAQKDMQSRDNNDPTRTKGYKDADHNYSSSLGSKDVFQGFYRQAFIEGYRRTYR